MNKNTGFTLVELLVVIAIVGVLASVLIQGLAGARRKNADTAARQALKNASTQAEFFYQANSYTYIGVCSPGSVGIPPVDSVYKIVVNAAKNEDLASINVNNLPLAASTARATCNTDGVKWAAEVPMKNKDVGGSGLSNMWCVDSSGFSSYRNLSIISVAGNVTCPAS